MQKNNLFLNALTVILLFTVVNAFSQSKEVFQKKENFTSQKLDLENQKLLDLENKIVYEDSRFNFKDSLKNENLDVKSNPNEKSPLLGALFSGVIPGAGQFYAKSYIKSAIFLGVEGGLWILYAVFQGKGNDQTNFFQGYADQNWDIVRYANWLKAQAFPGANAINTNASYDVLRAEINACEEQNFSHTLPLKGEQQYYEVIGKYENFLAGWSTASQYNITKNNYFDVHVAQVDYYMTERQKANDYYNNGSLTLTGIIINHVLSLADAVWSVFRYNSRLSVQGYVDVKSRFSVLTNQQVLVPHANLVVNF